MSERDRVKRALETQLQLYGDELVFQGEVDPSEGPRRIFAKEMLELLQVGHPIAEDFLDQIYATALMVLGMKAKRSEING